MPTPEKPVPLSTLRKMHPTVDRQTIEYLTLRYCSPKGDAPPEANSFRGLTYLPSEFARALQSLRRAQRTPAVQQYVETGITWVSRSRLMRRFKVNDQLADRMATDGLIRQPRVRRMRRRDGKPVRRKFYPLEDIDGVLSLYRVPLSERLQARPLAELVALPDGELVTIDEAEVYGFKRAYLEDHSDLPSKGGRRVAPATPCPPLGRLIHAEWVSCINAAGRRSERTGYLLGDLRAIRRRIENPPVPDGCFLVRDALPRLAGEAIKVSESQLKALIKAGYVRGGKAPCFKRNCAPQDMWYMSWADRFKIADVMGGPHSWQRREHEQQTPQTPVVQLVKVVNDESAPVPTHLHIPPPTSPALSAAEVEKVFDVEVGDRMYPAEFYATKYGLDPDRLRQAVRRGHLTRSVKRGSGRGQWFHHFDEVRQHYPQEVHGDPNVSGLERS